MPWLVTCTVRFIMRTIAFVVSSLIASQASLVAAQVTSPPPSPTRPPPSQERESVTNVSGTVVGYTTTPRGDMNGIVLDSGMTVRFPTQAGTDVSPLVARGQRVNVEGTLQERQAGRVLEATTITNAETQRSVDVTTFEVPSTRHGSPVPTEPERGYQEPPPRTRENMTPAAPGPDLSRPPSSMSPSPSTPYSPSPSSGGGMGGV